MYIHNGICYPTPESVADITMSFGVLPSGFLPVSYSVSGDTVTYTDVSLSTQSVSLVVADGTCPFSGPFAFMPDSIIADSVQVAWAIAAIFLTAYSFKLIQRAF